MYRTGVALLVLIAFAGLGVASLPPRASFQVAVESEPDTTKAKALDRWPDDRDLAKLQSVEGKPKWQVIRVLGHPRHVERKSDGTEVWDYPWCAACTVWIKNGKCSGTLYTGGY